jgi:hypothetical protein
MNVKSLCELLGNWHYCCALITMYSLCTNWLSWKEIHMLYLIYVLWCILMCNLASYGANLSSLYFIVIQMYSIQYTYIYLGFFTNSLFCVLVWPFGVQALRLCLCSSCRWSSALIWTWERDVCIYMYRVFQYVFYLKWFYHTNNEYYFINVLFIGKGI